MSAGMPRRPARTSQREPDRRRPRHEDGPPVRVRTVARVSHAGFELRVATLHREGSPDILSIAKFSEGRRQSWIELTADDLDGLAAGIAAMRAAR